MPAVLNRKPPADTARELSVEFQDDRQNEAWDEFVESLPGGHHEQTSLWGQVRARHGWEVCRILIRENGKLVAGTQMQTRSLRRLGKMAYVTYGPCLRNHDPVLEQAMINALKRRARATGVSFMVVGLPYDGYYQVPGLLTAGFRPKPASFPPQFLEATAVINLAADPEQILSAMHHGKRKNIRQSLKRGIKVVEQGAEGLREFHKLMLMLCQRRNTTPNPANVEFFLELWERFRPKGWVRLFFAMNGAEPVSAVLAFTFGGWFRAWKIGWSGQHGNLKPNEALWWHMILWARENGCRFFDFVEINPEEARRVARDGTDDGRPETVTSFKLGFGAESLFLPGAYYYVVNPVWRKLFQFTAAPWLDLPAFSKAAGPLLRRISKP